jgi:hypothetical protein
VPAFEGAVDAFLLHPYGDLDKSVETGPQSRLQPVYAASIAGRRMMHNLVTHMVLAKREAITQQSEI